MTRASRLRSGFIAALAVSHLCTAQMSAQAQSVSAQVNRVTSCITGAPGTVTLVTSKGVPLMAPWVQYLPGPDECTVLVADFPGLSWIGEPRVIRPESSGIVEVRVGQFQDSPPICRVSVTSRNPALFKNVSFKNFSGQLVVTWSNGENGSLPLAKRLPPYTEQGEVASRSSHQGTTEPTTPVATVTRTVTTMQTTTKSTMPSSGPAFAYAYSNTPSYTGSPQYLPRVQYAPPPPMPSSSAFDPGPPQPDKPTKQALKAKSSPAAVPKVAALKAHSPKPASKIAAAPSQLATVNQAAAKPTAQTVKVAQVSATAQDPDADDLSQAKRIKQSGILHKFGKLFNGDDRESKTKLTKPDPAKVASSGQPDTINKEAQSTPSALVSQPSAPPLAIKMVSDESSVVDNLKIELTAQKKLNYKAFRMHNPERYVIDFDQLPELAKLALPDSDSPLFYRFRAGTLPDKPNVDRLVLDLPDDQVQISNSFDDQTNTLSLSLLRKSSPSDATASGVASSPPTAPALTELTNMTTTTTTTAVSNQPPLTVKNPGKRVIVLDAGHGGSDPGAQRADISEKDLTLAIVSKLKLLLEAQGDQVVMTRSDDTFVSLEDRVKITNQILPDIFLSVHINAMESANDITGIETYYQTEQSKPLAASIHQGLVSELSAPDRSIRKARFYVINHTQVPAILAEVGFISNKDERNKLDSTDYQQKIAQALAHGVGVYLAAHPQGSSLHLAQTAPSSGSSEGTTTTGAKSSQQSFAVRGVPSQTAF